MALIKVASNATIVLMSRALEEVAREAIELSQEDSFKTEVNFLNTRLSDDTPKAKRTTEAELSGP